MTPKRAPARLFCNLIVLLFLLTSAHASGNTQQPCSGTLPSRLSVGLHGRVSFVDGTTTRLRSGPGTNYSIVREMAEGTEFDVVGGPDCGTYTWWQIRLGDGAIGWSAEGVDSSYYLEPLLENADVQPETVVQPILASQLQGQIAFIASDNNCNTGRIEILDLSSSSTRNVPLDNVFPERYTALCQPNSIQWSPDGHFLAFIRSEVAEYGPGLLGQSSNNSLAIFDADTGVPRVLTSDIFGTFDWSPDGSRIVHDHDPNTSLFESPNPLLARGLSVIDINSGEDRPLVPPASGLPLWYPHWSPNGTQISFYEGAHEGLGRFALASSDGSNYKRLDPTIGNVDWSPDGSELVFDDVTFGLQGGTLYIADSEGNNQGVLVSGLMASSPRWSPDGTQIAFRVWPYSTPAGSLWVVQPDGSNLRQVSDVDVYSLLDWSPDGNYLVFTDSEYNIRVVPVAGGASTVVGQGYSASWRPESVIPPATYELRYTFFDNADEIIEIRLPGTLEANSDGSVVADVEIYNPTSIAYGVSFELLNGEISGSTIEYLLENDDELPVLMPKVTQSLGTITFYPDTELQITLSRFGFSFADESYLRQLDALTWLSVLSGVGYVPAQPTPRWWLEDIVSTFIRTLPFGTRIDAFRDGALLALSAIQGDEEEQAEILLGFLKDNPEIVVEYLKRQGVEIAASEVENYLASIELVDKFSEGFAVLRDFVGKPERARVIIFTQPSRA